MGSTVRPAPLSFSREIAVMCYVEEYWCEIFERTSDDYNPYGYIEEAELDLELYVVEVDDFDWEEQS